MGFKNDCKFFTVDDMKATFLQFLWCYETDFNNAWLYGVKMDQSNPHSLVSALGLDDDGVLKVISLFKIAYHHGDTLQIRREF